MQKTLTTVLAAAAIMVSTATPQRAVADDYAVARTLASIAGIAVLGKLLYEHGKNQNDDRKPYGQSSMSQPYYPQYAASAPQYARPVPRYGRPLPQYAAPPPRYARPVPHSARPTPHYAKRRTLPGQCLRKFETWNGSVRMIGRRCLERRYGHMNRLPQHCATQVGTERGPRFGYAPRCLRDHGFTLARK